MGKYKNINKLHHLYKNALRFIHNSQLSEMIGGDGESDNPTQDLPLKESSEIQQVDDNIENKSNTQDINNNIENQQSNEQLEQPEPSILQPINPSKLPTYTIKQGTYLYHGSLFKETFDPTNIKLENDTLTAFFSPSKRLAADRINGCSLYPDKGGFIHVFIVDKDIDNIIIISRYDVQQNDMVLTNIQNKFCNATNNSDRYNGIGFFFSRNDIVRFDENGQPTSEPLSEFAICDPSKHLRYLHTQRCTSVRQLSNNYRFDN
jgi:hypothetical protein